MLEVAFYYFPPLLALVEFFNLGGPVLFLIAFIGFIMWSLVFERIIFLYQASNQQRAIIIEQWHHLDFSNHWSCEQIRNCWVSEYAEQLDKHLLLIKTCIAIAPLLGLLGTVTGMVEVFDVMSTSGLGDARAMSSGIAKSTIPTMAGMVISLSGFMVITFIQQKITTHQDKLSENLTH